MCKDIKPYLIPVGGNDSFYDDFEFIKNFY